MRLRNHAFAIGMALLAPLSLQGQEVQRFDVGGSAVWAFDGLKSVTNNSFAGYHLEAGYNGNLAATDVPFRASFGMNLFPGADKGGSKASLTGYQVSGDIFTKTGIDKLRLVSGISLNRWKVKEEVGTVSTTTSVKGLKFGGRLGLDYTASAHVSCGLMLQLVELGTDANSTKGVNPSWLEFGVRYRF